MAVSYVPLILQEGLARLTHLAASSLRYPDPKRSAVRHSNLHLYSTWSTCVVHSPFGCLPLHLTHSLFVWVPNLSWTLCCLYSALPLLFHFPVLAFVYQHLRCLTRACLYLIVVYFSQDSVPVCTSQPKLFCCFWCPILSLSPDRWHMLNS